MEGMKMRGMEIGMIIDRSDRKKKKTLAVMVDIGNSSNQPTCR